MPSSQCPACGAEPLSRSRSASLIERFRKRFSARRLYRCTSCRWRGWLYHDDTRLPSQAIVESEPPRLDLINSELVRRRKGINGPEPSNAAVTLGA